VTVDVVVVAWNSADDLPAMLDSLPAAFGAVDYELVVVDNASGDDSAALAAAREGTRLVRLESNTGFTHAANVGARLGHGDLLLFLNPDVVCPPASMARLVDALASRPEAWGATPWFRFPDGEPQYFWRRLVGGAVTVLCFTRWGKRLDAALGHRAWRWRCYRDLPDPPGRRDIDGVGAACLLVGRSAFTEAGGFDERYFNFFQDGHLERQLRRQGRPLLGVGDVEVSHRAGSTLVRLPPWQVDAQMLLALRQFVRDEPPLRRLLVEAAIRLDLWLPHPHRKDRRRAVLAPVRAPLHRG